MKRAVRVVLGLLAATLPGAGVPATAASLPRISINKESYVSVTDAAKQMELRGTWTEGRKSYVLTGNAKRVEFAPNDREIKVDGLRVHLGNPVVLRSNRLYLSRTDYEHTLLPMVRPDLAGLRPPMPALIAIDPGHGGNDNGTANDRYKLKEKDLTLDVARRLRAALQQAGYRVVMTREDDRNPTFEQRDAAANSAGADLFVSIHFNALAQDSRTSGTEVFVFTPAGQRSTASWSTGDVDSEKQASPVNQFDGPSALLAHSIHRDLVADLRTSDRGQKTGHLGVLRRAGCPAVLVESIFLSNEEEARKAATPAFRQEIAEAIARGITDYAGTVRSLRRNGP